jgi:hypothetical protein
MKQVIFSTALAACLLGAAIGTFAQQSGGTIEGQVSDSLGYAVVGATVTAVDRSGKEKSTVTNSAGNYSISGLAPGRYTIRAAAESFAIYEATDVDVIAGKKSDLPVILNVEGVKEEVEVSEEGQVSTDSQNNASALVLKEEDLASLPDDPDDLEAALQALAGGAAGPNGGQIYIDGFEGGNIPSKESIREIRINQNPFSAEYDRLGFGRIEILTKPGSDKFRGQGFFNFNNDALNTRNPFADNKANSQRMFYGGSVSGPVIKNKASFFLSVDNRQIDNGSIVNATVIDSNYNVIPFQQEFTIPSRRFSIGPRFDYQINNNNTIVARYEFERRTSDNQGVGGFSLPSRATESTNTEHTFQITETAILNAKTINETRFQFRDENTDQVGDNSIPTINVSDAFTGGGSSVGLNFNKERSWELQNYTTTALGADSQHALKFGARVRGSKVDDRTESNYGGTFTFAGFQNDNGTPDDTSDDFFVSSIEQYQQKLLGETDPRYNPNQFSITAGNPVAGISQYELGVFVTDDWRINPGLTLSFGLRYENQTNIDDNLNFAPRVSFAYSPGAGGASAPKTVFRGGFGIFYSRFRDDLSLQARRLDGISQQQYVIGRGSDLLGQPVFSLDGVTNVPTVDQLSPLSSIPRLIAGDAQAPYTIQGALSVERQLPGRSTISVYYVTSRDLHQIRSRNINAPVCPPGFECPVGDTDALAALRPDPTLGNLYQYETSGYSNSQRLIVSFRTFLSQRFTLFSNYILAKSKSNSDGGFPSYSYNITDDYGDSGFDTRHTFFMGGSIGVPYGISLRPFIIARSGSPFDITSGQDRNGDSIFNDRPTFGELSTRCSELALTSSWCDVAGYSADATLPRNFGRGPAFFTVNLGLDKTFGFGKVGGDSDSASGEGARGGGMPGMGRRGGGGRGGGMFGGGGGERSRYNLTVGVRFSNLLNTNNANTPVGNLSSSLFGQSTNTAGGFGRGGGNSGGNRSIEFQTRFRF